MTKLARSQSSAERAEEKCWSRVHNEVDESLRWAGLVYAWRYAIINDELGSVEAADITRYLLKSLGALERASALVKASYNAY